MKNQNVNAQLLNELINITNELSHWHGWRCQESPTYAGSDGYRICKGRIDRAEAAIAAAQGEKETMQLRNNRQVIHSPEPNGSQLATMADGLPMSQEEWEEYCALVATLNAADIASRRAARLAANREAFEANLARRRHNEQRQEAVNVKEVA